MNFRSECLLVCAHGSSCGKEEFSKIVAYEARKLLQSAVILKRARGF